MVGLTIVMSASIFTPSASAQADYVLELQVSERTVSLVLTNVVVPVGALEVEIEGLGELASDCEVVGGLGACGRVDGVLRIVAFNATGWSNTSVIMRATAIEPVAGPEIMVRIGRGTDVNGVDLIGAVAGDSLDDPSATSFGWGTVLIVGGIVSIMAIVALRQLRSRSALSSPPY